MVQLPFLLERAKEAMHLMGKANQRARGSQGLALQSRTIVRSTLKGNNCASDGRLESAQQRLNLGNDAWLDITIVGRKLATSCIRAMSAPTDFRNQQAGTVSLLRPQLLKFVVVPRDCPTH